MVASGLGQITELPDSLEDSADLAAQACAEYIDSIGGTCGRCRVDFDTSVGDETYTTLKSSTEFMQRFVASLCYAKIPGMMQRRLDEKMRVVEARAKLSALMTQAVDGDEDIAKVERQQAELMRIISSGGKSPDGGDNDDDATPQPQFKARIYFPDEGSAALARRDWTQVSPTTNEALVPDCVEFASLGGMQLADTSKDALIFFFCPRAAESDFVEEILYSAEQNSLNLTLSVFVNPLLVDMGVTGFGMAGRMLRERLIDPLTNVYYLRTLPWGALTRLWPRDFTVWQEDAEAEGGYRMIKIMDTLPTNPEVEDVYDIANGNMNAPKEGFGLLNALGDFVNGMMSL